MNKLKKYVYAQNGYSVKSGDTLSAIAKANNIPLESLIKDNNIANSDKLSIGQKLVINKPKDDESYSGKSYRIAKGDTLYDISKKYNVGINQLKKYNNLDSDTIYENKILKIPKQLQEQVIAKDKKAIPTFKSNSVINNEKLIQDYYKSRPDEQYTVLDKKAGKLKTYRGNTLISDINVGTGKNKGDYSTGLGGVKNYYTGAGVYTIADPSEYKQLIDDPYNKKLYGDNIIGYKNENGVIQGSFLHQVPEGNRERELKLEDSNPNNNRFSQGCVNCKKKDFESIVKSNVLKNSKLYILPEDDSNFFENKNGKLNFTTNKNKDIRGYNFTYDDKGNYLSNKVRDASYRDFNIDKDKLQSSIFDNRNTAKQYEILKSKKRSLMKDLNLDSDTYDELARQMIGHIKQETGSGYIKDIGERIANNIMDIIPLGKHTAENSSRGDLQIRYNQIPKEILKKYNVNSPDDLDDIEKAIPIGMFLKKDGLQQVISKRNKLPNLTRENLTNFVPYQYNQAKLLQDPNTNPENNKYVKNVLNFANSLKQTGGSTFEDWYKTVPENKNDTTSYNLKRAYELAPREELDAFVKNPKAHLRSVYENNEGVYEFLKSKNHPTINKELEWYNSKQGSDFKSKYDLDTSGEYYKYIPKSQYGGGYKSDRPVTQPRLSKLQIDQINQANQKRLFEENQAQLKQGNSTPTTNAVRNIGYKTERDKRINSRQDKANLLGLALSPVPVVGEVYNAGNTIANTAVDLAQGEYGDALLSIPGAGLSKYLNKNTVKTLKGNYKNVLNKGLDIHDVRLKYHNNNLLNFDEVALLNKEGKGNVNNYKGVVTNDIAGKTQIEDLKNPYGGVTSNRTIKEIFNGKDYPKVNPQNNTNQKEFDINIKNNPEVFISKEKNLSKSKKSKNIEDFIIQQYEPYQRTATSRQADAWLSKHYTNPTTKEKFLNYGGTEKEWLDVLNSLENPIKSNYNWGKNRPGGVYINFLNQASIPLDAPIDFGVHEGTHKTKIVLDKNTPVLPNLWNDLTDAVREIPSETYPEIMRMRNNMGWKPETIVNESMLNKGLKTIFNGYDIPNKIKDKNSKIL